MNRTEAKSREGLGNKTLKIDVKGIIKNSIKIMVSRVVKDPFSIVDEVWDVLTENIKLEDKPEYLAWKLIIRSVTNAVLDVSRNFSLSEVDKIDLLDNLIDELKSIEVSFNEKFFINPSNCQFFNDLQTPIDLFFEAKEGYNLDYYSVLKRVYPSFLEEEWRKDKDKYQVLYDKYESTPFSSRVIWNGNYRRYVKTEIFKPVDKIIYKLKDKKITLNDLYIFPRCVLGLKENTTTEVQTCEERIFQWIRGDHPDEHNVKFITGSLGVGKSSYCQKIAEYTYNKSLVDVVLYISLANRNWDEVRNVKNLVSAFLKQRRLLEADPFEVNAAYNSYLLIFDGVDEITGSDNGRELKDFIQSVKNLNVHSDKLLKIIITGRDIVTSQVVGFFYSSQILRILPYFFEPTDYQFTDLIDNDCRIDWWEKFISLLDSGNKKSSSNEIAKGIVNELDELNLKSLSSNPLTNYLLGELYLNEYLDQKELSPIFSTDFSLKNRNEVYEKVFEQVHNKYHESTNFDKSEFFSILQEIASAKWFNYGGDFNEETIINQCENSSYLIDNTLYLLRDGELKKLLAVFYFKSTSTNSHQFEFIHRSFYEYFLARKIISVLEKLTLMNHDMETLQEWVSFFSINEIEVDIHQFLEELINSASDDDVKKWQKVLSKLLNIVIVDGVNVSMLPVAIESDSNSVLDVIKSSNNSEIALIKILALCSRKIEKRCKVGRFNDQSIFGQWWKRIVGHSPIEKRDIHLQKSLQYLEINKSSLDLIYFYSCDLSYSKFKDCKFSNTIFKETTLNDVSFKNCSFPKVTMKEAMMEGVYFDGEEITDADFEEANLANAKFKISKIKDVSLYNATLTEAVFKDGVVFENVCLEDAYLSKAILHNAILSSINFKRCDLTNANLSEATLYGADFSQAILEGCNLSDAKFDDETNFYCIKYNQDTIFPDEIKDHPDYSTFIEVES